MGNCTDQMIGNYQSLLLIERSGFAYVYLGNSINFVVMIVSLVNKQTSSMRIDYVALEQKEPVSLTQFNTYIPKVVNGVSLKTLKDPTNRHPNVSLLAIALQNAV